MSAIFAPGLMVAGGIPMSVGSLAHGIGGGIVGRIRALPLWAEFILVLLAAFGPSICSSLMVALAPATAHLESRPLIFEAALRQLIVYEMATLVLLGGFLYLRGWSLRRVGLLPLDLKGVLVGLGLTLLTYMVYAGVWYSATPFFPQLATRADTLVATGITMPTAALISIVNPAFEEIFLVGYLISALKHRSPWAAAIVSSLIRVSCHLYQGLLGVLTILPMGLIFAAWYVRHGRLWPLVVAHAIMDFVGLALR